MSFVLLLLIGFGTSVKSIRSAVLDTHVVAFGNYFFCFLSFPVCSLHVASHTAAADSLSTDVWLPFTLSTLTSFCSFRSANLFRRVISDSSKVLPADSSPYIQFRGPIDCCRSGGNIGPDLQRPLTDVKTTSPGCSTDARAKQIFAVAFILWQVHASCASRAIAREAAVICHSSRRRLVDQGALDYLTTQRG